MNNNEQQKIQRIEREIQALIDRVRLIPGQEHFTLPQKQIHAAATTIVMETIVGKRAKEESTLFNMVNKVMDVVGHFNADGLTLRDYLGAILSNPQLLTVKPSTVIRNISDVASHFSEHGLTCAEYLQVALDIPALFLLPANSVKKNITETACYFAASGLSLDAYIKAALGRPQLFYQSPTTIIANITGVTDHFEKDGLTLPLYLEGVVKNTALFSQSPSTIIRHANIIKKTFDTHKIGVSGQEFWPWLMQNPLLLSLSDENLLTRSVLADCIVIKTHRKAPINTLKETKSKLANRCQRLEIPDPCIKTVGAIAKHMAATMKNKDKKAFLEPA